ncbi:hypothetical protein BDR26DRAFT_1009378 [Obelidium mucronatum]|nr:hypothetical protein BDR26DRAFT_1009378 [Obelidium mucronatum]
MQNVIPPRSASSSRHHRHRGDFPKPAIINHLQSASDIVPLFSITPIIPSHKPKQPSAGKQKQPTLSAAISKTFSAKRIVQNAKPRIDSCHNRMFKMTPSLRNNTDLEDNHSLSYIAEAAEPHQIAIGIGSAAPEQTAETPRIVNPKKQPAQKPTKSNHDELKKKTKTHDISTPIAIQISWEELPIPPETSYEFLLQTPIEGWCTSSSDSNSIGDLDSNTGGLDPDTCRALGIGVGNGASYDYIDRLDMIVSSNETLSLKTRPSSGGNGRKESARPSKLLMDIPNQKRCKSAPIGVLHPAEELDGDKEFSGNSHALDDDTIFVPVNSLSSLGIEETDRNEKEDQLPNLSTFMSPQSPRWEDDKELKGIQYPQTLENSRLPPLKLFSRGYISNDQSDKSKTHVFGVKSGAPSTVTIRNWQLQQDTGTEKKGVEHLQPRYGSRKAVGIDDTLSSLPTLGAIGLYIKPISGTVKKTKKDAVWGHGGKRRSNDF